MPAPYIGEEITLYNPDGSGVRVRAWGNQYAATFETLDGYTVVQHPDSRYFHYASLSGDKTTLVPTDLPVRPTAPPSLEVPRHIRVTRDSARSQAAALRDTGVQRRWEIRRQERRATARAALRAGVQAAPQPGTTGDYTGLCLLVQFPDVPATIARQEVDDFCNKVGYSGYGNNGSAYDYFLSVSDGKLRYRNVVTAYYTAAHNRSYYTDPAIEYGTRAQELIKEALDSLKANGFSFAPLSSDGSGYVYALSVFYAGNRINNWAEGLWPHSSALAAEYAAGAGKTFSDYQITDLGTQLTLRTFCHENGHMVCDFPDLYDYGNEGGGVGHYCLMCNGGSNTNPTQVSAYLKNVAGWTSRLTTLTPAMTAELEAGKNDFLIHRKGPTEYFILENRQQLGRDSALPDAGLAIWHVDELGSNNNEQMTPALHYELSLEQADNRFDLEHRANGGDAEDLYGAPATRFGSSSAPDSSWWDGTDSGLEIGSVTAPGAKITITTKGGAAMTGIVGRWAVIALDWGCRGSLTKVPPFTFKSDGTWTYSLGGGRWIQVGDKVLWNVSNAPGLIYTADTTAGAMTGVMGYAAAGGATGCFYALRSPAPGTDNAADGADGATGPAAAGGVPEDNDDPVLGPVG